VVHFRRLDKPKDDDITLELSKQHTYEEVTAKLAAQLELSDPALLRLTAHNGYSQQPRPQPFKHFSVERLHDMLVRPLPAPSPSSTIASRDSTTCWCVHEALPGRMHQPREHSAHIQGRLEKNIQGTLLCEQRKRSSGHRNARRLLWSLPKPMDLPTARWLFTYYEEVIYLLRGGLFYLLRGGYLSAKRR
jgi:hypothetical protein